MKQDRAWQGKVAIVTGGGSGLGKGLCEKLAALGARVIIADIDEARASALAAELTRARLSVVAQHVDVTDSASVDALVARAVELYDRLDYIFNNAGIASAGEYQELAAETVRRVIDVNLLGSAYGTLSAYRQMRRQGFGHIVNIASMYALMPSPLSAPYVAAKHGLSGLTQSMMIEARRSGVYFTLVCPGYIATNLFAASTYAGDLDLEGAEQLIPFSMLDVSTAVDRTLAAVRKRKSIAVFPAYVRFMWLLQRLSPRLLIWITALVFANKRKRLRTVRDQKGGNPGA